MAGYSIVLNLSGNAVSRTATLAKNLELANVAAASLAKNLALIGVNGRGINFNNLRGISPAQIRAGGTAEAQRIRAEAMAAATMQKAALRMEAAATKQNIAATKQNSAANRNLRGHSRKGADPFLTVGTSFGFGPFSGRFGQVITADQIASKLGVNPATLMKGVNIASIVTSAVTSGLRLYAKATTTPLMINGGLMWGLSSMLRSDFIGKGVALNNRRLMAQNVLGSEFGAANDYADQLAAVYGIDRGVALGNMSALAGIKVGGNKLSIQQAGEITRIGGLISQSSGAPVEKVMTNIQQLLAQSVPNLRDIRELINQAPILSRYAMKEMERRGITGDARDFLKDKQALLTVLSSFALDNPITPTMLARGQVNKAIANAGASIADNPAWGSVGINSVRIIDAMAGAFNKLLTGLTSDTNFAVSIENIALAFERIGQNAPLLTKWLGKLTSTLEDIGFDLGNKPAATTRVALRTVQQDNLNRADNRMFALSEFTAARGHLYSTPDQLAKAFNEWYSGEFTSTYMSTLRDVVPIGSSLTGNDRDNRYRIAGAKQKYATDPVLKNVYDRFYLSPINVPGAPSGIGASNVGFLALLTDLLSSPTGALAGMKPSDIGVGTGDSGEALTGTNRDRRNLEIHFHAPLVDLTQNIQTPDPQETAEEVYDGMEIAVSAAIQKSLLGASEKMSSRWY